jgi:leucyl/phenylalanyl-tRNA--protein transferase
MITWLAPDDPVDSFPPVSVALTEPNGLLAAGGDLAPERLLFAYAHGIFPWYSPGQQILWWSPDPREVFMPADFHRSRSLQRELRRDPPRMTVDADFTAVIDACAAPRGASPGTWITAAMRDAYVALHGLGHAHSVEAWRENELIGGVYGVRLGGVFFGESMFSAAANGSKMALAHLCDWAKAEGIRMIDCQFANPHLRTLGSRPLPRGEFLENLRRWCQGRS